MDGGTRNDESSNALPQNKTTALQSQHTRKTDWKFYRGGGVGGGDLITWKHVYSRVISSSGGGDGYGSRVVSLLPAYRYIVVLRSYSIIMRSNGVQSHVYGMVFRRYEFFPVFFIELTAISRWRPMHLVYIWTNFARDDSSYDDRHLRLLLLLFFVNLMISYYSGYCSISGILWSNYFFADSSSSWPC